jgi:hypothetical protein
LRGKRTATKKHNRDQTDHGNGGEQKDGDAFHGGFPYRVVFTKTMCGVVPWHLVTTLARRLLV